MRKKWVLLFPPEPLIFMKPPTALLLNDKPFYFPDFSKEIHYECEIVLKIVRNGRSVEPQFAHLYYEQIGLGIDFTARDIQAKCKEKGWPWEKAKAFDFSAVIGGSVTTIDASTAVPPSTSKTGAGLAATASALKLAKLQIV